MIHFASRHLFMHTSRTEKESEDDEIIDKSDTDHSRKSAHPLSRAYTNRPRTKAMTSATALLPKVPCCLKSFRNRVSSSRDPVMPVTKPAINGEGDIHS